MYNLDNDEYSGPSGYMSATAFDILRQRQAETENKAQIEALKSAE